MSRQAKKHPRGPLLQKMLFNVLESNSQFIEYQGLAFGHQSQIRGLENPLTVNFSRISASFRSTVSISSMG